jgi:hypothetical protein
MFTTTATAASNNNLEGTLLCILATGDVVTKCFCVISHWVTDITIICVFTMDPASLQITLLRSCNWNSL